VTWHFDHPTARETEAFCNAVKDIDSRGDFRGHQAGWWATF
jgi:hypothetical protein